jgi:hypothetical protein
MDKNAAELSSELQEKFYLLKTQEWNSQLFGENLEVRNKGFTSNAAQGNMRAVVRRTE